MRMSDGSGAGVTAAPAVDAETIPPLDEISVSGTENLRRTLRLWRLAAVADRRLDIDHLGQMCFGRVARWS